MNWFRSLPDYRRKIYLLLIIAILLTLPCYCIGLTLLILAPEESTPPSGAPGGSETWGQAVSLWAAAANARLARVQAVEGRPRPALSATMAIRPQMQIIFRSPPAATP